MLAVFLGNSPLETGKLQLSEYRTYDATGLAELVRKGDVQPTELLETALAGVAATNPALNAIVATFEDEARRFIKEELKDGPFKGVPFVLKDLTAHYAGQPTGAGWPPRASVTPQQDSELVRRFKKAGLVTFAKTAVPELAMDWTTRSRAHGVTNNPWNPVALRGRPAVAPQRRLPRASCRWDMAMTAAVRSVCHPPSVDVSA